MRTAELLRLALKLSIAALTGACIATGVMLAVLAFVFFG